MIKKSAAHVEGILTLTVEGTPIDLGHIRLPLRLTRVDSEAGTGRMVFGLGVDLEAAATSIRAVFHASEVGDE